MGHMTSNSNAARMPGTMQLCPEFSEQYAGARTRGAK